MRKALLITIVFLLLTLSMTQSAIAQRQNIITNQTTEPLYVVYSTKFGAHDAIPAGYWTAGWREIQAGQQEAFWAYDPHKIYFQIWKGSQRVKPLSSTQTLAFWINRNADFNVVTQQEINASITRGQLVYSSHDTSALTHSDGFMRYNNGSRITVTNAWVDVPDVPADDAMADDGEAEDADGAEISDGAEDGGDDGPFDGAAAIVSIDPPQVAPPVGSQLTIHLKITNAQNVLGYQATVNFDPSELRYISSAYADYPSAGAFFIPTRISEGKVLFVATGTEVGAASGTLGTVTFAVVASKKPTIWLTGVELAGGDGEALAVTTRGGSPQGERPFLSEDDDSATVPLVTEEDSEDVQAAVATDAPVVGPNTAINIPDPNLRIAIEKKLGKSPGAVITVSDMDTSLLSELKVVGKNIQDLTGLEFATHLTVLHLWGNQISDISPLAKIPLVELSIFKNQISDISPLAELINLVNLFIYDNQISDISPLAALTNLRNLWIYGNQISDISPLAALTNLLGLSISDNQISDISPLTALTNLRNLGLYGNQISDISPLTAFTNLRWLRLSTNQISDISPLAALTNLEWLELDENQISDISPLAALTNLNNLELYGNQISDISPLTALTNLRELRLDENQISDISPLAALTNLEWLELDENQISDISPLAALTNLEWLELKGNRISDISSLLKLTNLRRLELTDNPIPDLSALRALSVGLVVTNVDSLAASHTSSYGNCSSQMPDPNSRLMPPIRTVEKVPIRNKNGGNLGMFAETKGAPSLSDTGETLNWTRRLTEADDDDGPNVIITVEFLNGEGKEKSLVKDAAREWTLHGGLKFKFVESGPSDIRIQFNYRYLQEVQMEVQIDNEGEPTIKYTPTGNIYTLDEARTYNKRGYSLQRDGDSYREIEHLVQINLVAVPILVEIPTGKVYTVDQAKTYNKNGYRLLPASDWRSVVGTGAYGTGPNDPTMWFTTNFSHNTLLHEFGHALGLTHEHLSPKFKDYFAWTSEEKVLAYYKQSNRGWTDADVRHNVLTTRLVDTSTPLVDFDRRSVMTYEIPAELITARLNIPWVQEVAESYGIVQNRALSDGDKAIMKYLYPESLWASIEGSISIHGRDDDWPAGPDWYDNRDDPGEIAEAHFDYEGRDLKNYPNLDVIFVARWGGECRVEVYLCARNIDKDRGLEAGVFALLYEEDRENNTDLEDIVCETFYLPFGTEKTISLDRMKIRKGSNIAFTHSKCEKLYTHDEFYLGDITDIFGGVTWADVTLKLTAYDQTSPAITAESIGTLAAPSAAATADTASADVNGDGQVNVDDLVMVSNYLGQTGSIDPRVDVNGDGIVTIADLVLVAQHLGSSTYASAPIGVVPVGLKYSTVVGWIDQARVENDGSLVFQQGLAKLEYLLTLIIPEKTALLPNYPNPFNPETWLPYHLSEPAEVTLTIYGINGRVVRRLDLGHQDAGYYQSKSRAAYWDGRNNVGERVASGIYFYTLSVGDFSATQKLLIRK